MAARLRILFHAPRLFSVVMGSLDELSPTSFPLSIWLSLSTLLFSLLSLLYRFVFRYFALGFLLLILLLFVSVMDFWVRCSPLEGGESLTSSASLSPENCAVVGDHDSRLSEAVAEEEPDGGTRISDEEETQEDFVFRFRFPTYDELEKSGSASLNPRSVSSSSSSLSNRYEFLPEKSVSHFVEEAQIPSFTVEVLNSCSNNEIPGNGDFSIEEVPKKVPESEDKEGEITEKERELEQEMEDENKFLTEKDFHAMDSDTDSTAWSLGFSRTSQMNGTSSDGGFLSDTDFEDGSKVGTIGEFYLNVGYEPDDEINEELEKESEKCPETEKTEAKDSSLWDSEEGLETEWEHQELIEQLKMELKKVRATGLPTIFEESESPKIMGELKPWKIDEKFQHGDLMEELHKFYKSYRERMRKLDILNYQKMYAMGFLQSKEDPLKSLSSNSKPSSSPSSITSLLSHNLRLHRQKRSQVDPMESFIREVHCDLEMVYVGQMCLSWEFIQWQYHKAFDLWETDHHFGLHHYNQVAGEFQQFQVLLQRFLENEAFEGPRVENYVKHRCVARNLLQVPVIREDKTKDRRKGRRGRDHEDETITSDMLVEILQESIRVIWQFIRADKDHHHNTTILKRPRKFQVELQDPADEQLLTEIQAELQKKEKKLKEIVRSGHCILKKLQRKEEDDVVEGDVCFFSEVDMKLVGRVLRMSRITTDQLVWCRNKLSRINILNRQIVVEPSFFLFPS